MSAAASVPPGDLPAPAQALATVAASLRPVGLESVALADATGRILAETVRADRDLPPADVSAMDGVAGWSKTLLGTAGSPEPDAARLPIDGEVMTGSDPGALTPGSVRRVFTGGAIPKGANVVVPREWFDDHGDAITLHPDKLARIEPGKHIRPQGENTRAGGIIAAPGQRITPAMAAALASFGATTIQVHRRLRVTLLTTGNEVIPAHQTPGPFEIRNSNAPAALALLSAMPCIDHVHHEHVLDEPDVLTARLQHALDQSDAVLLTGGVSVGNHDHVPESLQAVGAQTLVHRIAMRPGKPNLGAVGPNGQLIWGLPGNPVSVLVGLRRFVAPLLDHRAGNPAIEPPQPTVELTEAVQGPDHLWLYPPVKLQHNGSATVVGHRGSGDPIGLAASDGFVEVPPVSAPVSELVSESAPAVRVGAFPFFAWTP